MFRRLFIPVVALAVSAALPLSARASERITLSNGFVQLCNRHAQIDGRVRLYLNSGEDNYIEFAPEQVASVEVVADPLPTVQPLAPPAPPAPRIDKKLTSGDLHQILSHAGQQHHLDADLLASVVKAESNGNSRAVSRAGAQGLMQLMPQTAADLGVRDSFEPGENVQGGSAYLDALLARYHDNLALALAAYNAGPQAVDKYNGIPPYRETRAYVARVIHEFNRRVLAREVEARRMLAASAPQPATSR